MLIRPAVFADVPAVTAGFTTRRGGASAAPFEALNLSVSVEDAPEAVAANRERVGAELGVPPERWALAGQVHGADVRVIDAPGLYRNTDGLVTATRGLALGILAADCAAVLLADAAQGVIGACHAGWRGTAAGIVGRTIEQMVTLGARPAAVRAYVSPCISVAQFEVGPEVAAQFDEAVVHQAPEQPRPYVDLKAALHAQLRAAGVPEAQIEIDPACTASATDRFFSHRAEDGTTGRMMGLIALRTS